MKPTRPPKDVSYTIYKYVKTSPELADALQRRLPEWIPQKAFLWTDSALQKEALKYKTKVDFLRGNQRAHHAATRHGILDHICKHMVPLKRPRITLEIALSESLKFRTKSSFEKGSPGAYKFVVKHGIIDKACKHMPVRAPGRWRRLWTEETVLTEALRYSTRATFKKGSGAYQWARSHDILEKCCKHMPRHASYALKSKLNNRIKRAVRTDSPAAYWARKHDTWARALWT